MATFVASKPLDMRMFFSVTDDQDEIGFSATRTTVTLSKTDSTFVATGRFTLDIDNELKGNSTINTMQESWNGSLAWRLTGVDFKVSTFDRYYDDFGKRDDAGFGNYVFAGNDSIVGSAGADTLAGYGGNDSLKGGSGNDVLLGGAGADTLNGGAGADTLNGGAQNELLRGGTGNDVLRGESGNDNFRFDTALSTSTVENVDRIKDFNPTQDTIQLENSIFTKLGAGTGAINPAFFKANTAGVARDSNDYIVYETDTGKLFYDANGSAAGGSVQIASLQPNLELTSADYVLV